LEVLLVTHGQPLRGKNRITAKHALFLVLGLMTLFVLYRDEGFIFHPESATWTFFQPVAWKISIHALGGAVALVLGALQFSTRLRQQRPVLHRILGRCYIGGVMVAAPMAVYLSFTHGLPIMSRETAVQASLWAITTLMALRAVRNCNFEVHKQWMMRSYAITLIFVISRIVLAVPRVAPTSDIGAERLNWLLVVCALFVPQLIINWHQLFPGNAR
jgi:hypothetical protein